MVGENPMEDREDKNATPRVVLGMSGGVDSAVAAVILMRAGYDVVGVTCHFRNSESSKKAERDARGVCRWLGLVHYVADCTEEFEQCVVSEFVDQYANGLTPSPCVGCNATCKIPVLLEVADELGCEYVATGHYARVVQMLSSNRYAIKTALDQRKDQSYMLGMLRQDQLARLLLPLGGTTKTEVRMIARDMKLSVAEKEESQDICFIEGDYRSFLAERGVNLSPGNIVTVEGKVVGHHDGLEGFTVGQRKGIGVAAEKPYYVVEKRLNTAELVVGFAEQARVRAVMCGSMNYQLIDRLDAPCEAQVKLRYRSQPAPCIIEPNAEGQGVRITLRDPEAATSPGQFAVLYNGDTVLGAGMIMEVELV